MYTDRTLIPTLGLGPYVTFSLTERILSGVILSRNQFELYF
jgi:hypothetical protein